MMPFLIQLFFFTTEKQKKIFYYIYQSQINILEFGVQNTPRGVPSENWKSPKDIKELMDNC